MLNIQTRAQRKIAKRLLDMIILQLLYQKPTHGYMIMVQIRRTYGIYLSPSSVYPLLGTLEENGYIESEWKTNFERAKKVYSLTTEGKKFLEFTQESLVLVCRNLMINGKTNTFTAIGPDKLSLQVKRLKSTR